MVCEEMMSKVLIQVTTKDLVKTAARKMRDENIGFLPVCDSATGRVVGVITDRDIALRVVALDRPANTPVALVMSDEVVACRPDDDVITAERLMGKRQKSRILCIDADGILVGVISLCDIALRDDEPRALETMRQVTRREAHA